jgi:hypothetical protein
MTDKAANVVEFQPRPMGVEDFAAGAVQEYLKLEGFKAGQFFVIATINAGDFIEWQESNEGPSKRNAGLKLIIKSVVDGLPEEGAKGERIMTDAHLPMLKRLPVRTTERIVREIIEFNGLIPKGDKTAAELAAKKD